VPGKCHYAPQAFYAIRLSDAADATDPQPPLLPLDEYSGSCHVQSPAGRRSSFVLGVFTGVGNRARCRLRPNRTSGRVGISLSQREERWGVTGVNTQKPTATVSPVTKHAIQSQRAPACARTKPPTAGAEANALVNAIANAP
jgi:hypothetical protein